LENHISIKFTRLTSKRADVSKATSHFKVGNYDKQETFLKLFQSYFYTLVKVQAGYSAGINERNQT